LKDSTFLTFAYMVRVASGFAAPTSSVILATFPAL